MHSPMRSPRGAIVCLGCASLLAALGLAALSWGIGAFAPFGNLDALEVAGIRGLLRSVLPSSAGVELANVLLVGASPLARPALQATLVGVGLGIQLAAALALLWILASGRRAIDASIVHLVQRFAAAFGIACCLAYPICTPDFWLSPAWGRMALAGDNPYYSTLSHEMAAGLPLPAYTGSMTYGPLWALASQGIAAVAFRNPILEFLCHKLLLLTFFLVCLGVARQLTAERGAREQARTLCLIGWLPTLTHYAIAEGHNDVVVAAGVLAWLMGLRSASAFAPVGLAAATAVKYVTAPLFALYAVLPPRPRPSPRRSVVGWLLAALVAAAGFAAFYRGGSFFAPLGHMRGWTFFSPISAAHDAAGWIGIPIPWVFGRSALEFLVVGLGVTVGVQHLMRRSEKSFVELVLISFIVALTLGTGHVWPWYWIWPPAPAAVLSGSWIARSALAAVALAPALDLFWLAASGWEDVRPISAAWWVLVVLAAVVANAMSGIRGIARGLGSGVPTGDLASGTNGHGT